MLPGCRTAFTLLALLAFSASESAQQSQQVFPLPEGAYAHDAAPAPDGKVWYSAQRNGALGIFDPSTGQSREIKLGPKSAPHGVIQGPDGAAWLTDGGQNAIVRVDPQTEKVKVWKLPDETGYTNLNTAVFDKDGLHWFTGQNGFYGRLDPRSGELNVWKAPRGRGPYGITATPEGDVYYASLAGNHIARIDKATGEATVIEPPTKGQGARRVWSTRRGASGYRSGMPVRLGCTIQRRTPGGSGSCRVTSHKPTPSMSMRVTWSGCPTGAPTLSCPLIRPPNSSRAIRCQRPTPTCAKSSGAPARSGSRSRGQTG
ncbi:hypothetical protein KBI52_17115 [Microvirga sp. HBU67558]|uniref:Vgb family protein n=1 Tax=Microvirga TaxID=186650 RepID=UPI001B393A77|nr:MULTISPECIES: hypothetical protein [unclassified Microvirga]MBQ0821915.1 hypothetical protein [Microvirga sp. HBU67558]